MHASAIINFYKHSDRSLLLIHRIAKAAMNTAENPLAQAVATGVGGLILEDDWCLWSFHQRKQNYRETSLEVAKIEASSADRNCEAQLEISQVQSVQLSLIGKLLKRG